MLTPALARLLVGAVGEDMVGLGLIQDEGGSLPLRPWRDSIAPIRDLVLKDCIGIK